MQLSYLLQNTYLIPPNAERKVNHLITDHRKIQPGDVFIALKGAKVDGRIYIEDAIKQGAAAILTEGRSSKELVSWQDSTPVIPIFNLQQELGEIAARFYDYPSQKLRVIGVTGTNGKTSCTHFIAQMLDALNIRCGIIGTLGCGFYGDLKETGFTTPDAITLQATLNHFVKEGAQAVAMEVSSHSIHQGRVNGIDFEVGVFTNLTQDHLDYHGTMESYAAIKRQFLAEFPIKNLVINADDGFGAKWIKEFSADKKVFTYSKQDNARHIELSMQGLKAAVHTHWGDAILSLPIIGEFNLSNALAVLTALCSMEFPLGKITEELHHLSPVPGRMQSIVQPEKPLVVIDFAHTPDALEKVLETLRAHSKGKLICVFGCGGDRDQTKRPLMGKMVEKYADIAIITNDNPRHEQPEAIAKDILQGFLARDRVQVVLDRSKAIQKSIQLASSADCILIAGKGAEKYQQIGDEKMPFSDVEQALHFLKTNEL